jgi:hypothetical protein
MERLGRAVDGRRRSGPLGVQSQLGTLGSYQYRQQLSVAQCLAEFLENWAELDWMRDQVVEGWSPLDWFLVLRPSEDPLGYGCRGLSCRAVAPQMKLERMAGREVFHLAEGRSRSDPED